MHSVEAEVSGSGPWKMVDAAGAAPNFGSLSASSAAASSAAVLGVAVTVERVSSTDDDASCVSS